MSTATVGGVTTDEALRQCRALTRRRARNFYHGLRLSPEPQRSALYAVYAWMRRADDLVDDAVDGRDAVRARLDIFRTRTVAALSGAPVPDDPVWVGLAETARRFDLDPQPLLDMIAGQTEDLEGVTYATFDDLRRYCHRVASSVGLVCVGIWGYDDPLARSLAIDRGVAFQLTNILRDFAADHDTGRVYLPAEDFDRFDLRPADLRGWSDPERCGEFYHFQTGRAETYYRLSAGLEELITPSCVRTLWVMTEIYHRLLRKISADPARVMARQRVRLGAVRKGVIVLQATLGAGVPRSRA